MSSVAAAPAREPAAHVLLAPIAGITTEPFPSRRTDRLAVTVGLWCRLGAQGEGGVFLAVDDQAGGGRCAPRWDRSCSVSVGGDVALQGAGVLGGHGEP